jgi:hypothetical protein
MTIRLFSKSKTHSEFSNFAPFPIDLLLMQLRRELHDEAAA